VPTGITLFPWSPPLFVKTTCTSAFHVISKNIDIKPLKPRKIIGLPIRPFFENPAKCPDPIRAIFKAQTSNRAQSGFFKTGILCPEKFQLSQMVQLKRRCQPKTFMMRGKAL
jgi:hypothetical protein